MYNAIFIDITLAVGLGTVPNPISCPKRCLNANSECRVLILDVFEN